MPEPEQPQRLETPAELRAALEVARDRENWHREVARAFALEAESLERRLRLAEGGTGLTIADESGTFQTQMHVESAGAGRSRGQMSKAAREHPFGKMLERRKITVAVVAEFLTTNHPKPGKKVPRSSVQAWYKPTNDPSYRPIKRWAADALKAEYGVPLNAWPRVVE